MDVLPRHKRDGNFANQWQKRHCTPSRMTFRPWIEFASGNRVPPSFNSHCDRAHVHHNHLADPFLAFLFPAGLDYFCPSNRRRLRWMSLPFQLGHSSIDWGESRESIEWRQIAKHRVRQPPRRRSHHFRTLTMDAAIIVRGESAEKEGCSGFSNCSPLLEVESMSYKHTNL